MLTVVLRKEEEHCRRHLQQDDTDGVYIGPVHILIFTLLFAGLTWSILRLWRKLRGDADNYRRSHPTISNEAEAQPSEQQLNSSAEYRRQKRSRIIEQMLKRRFSLPPLTQPPTTEVEQNSIIVRTENNNKHHPNSNRNTRTDDNQTRNNNHHQKGKEDGDVFNHDESNCHCAAAVASVDISVNNHSQSHSHSHSQHQCSICLNNFQERDYLVYSNNCPHEFHQVCMLDWLMRSKEETCPTCRGQYLQHIHITNDSNSNSNSNSNSSVSRTNTTTTTTPDTSGNNVASVEV